ncbi:MAG TPA: nucleoside deaminase [Treponemataceae bacterium]|nr:nucleoside deaminase [Treponemataceae bacterium]
MMERFTIAMPPWLKGFLAARPRDFKTPEGRMAFAIALSAENARRGTGGPFGAAVFSVATRELVSCGVNRVVGESASIAHAEIMALTLAERGAGSWDLGPANLELVSSAAPCAMCLGAVVWSGVRALLIGARREDVERYTGFDEGPIPPDWRAELERRGIAVQTDILRIEASAILDAYGKSGGAVYNSKANRLRGI